MGDNSSEDFGEKFPIGRGHFGVSYRQETMRERFPTEVKRFGLPYRQETMCERFPIEMKHYAQHTDRKLFANGFLWI